MTLSFHETIRKSDNLLKRYRRLIDFEEFEKQISLYYGQQHFLKYLGENASYPTIAVSDVFYYPVQSKRLGKTVAYLRGGETDFDGSRTIVWWADLLGAFSGKINFKD